MKYLSQRRTVDQMESARLFNACIAVVCGWILIEVPLEVGGSISPVCLLAVATSKVLICGIGWGAIVNLRYASEVFTFICAASVFAIAPALPLEYARCVPIALISTIECIAKAVCVVLFFMASVARDHIEVDMQMLERYSDD
jgi:hypothetical protein